MDKRKKTPQFSASQPTTNDEESPYDGPTVPQKSQELTRELDGKEVYATVQMPRSQPPKSDAPQPKKDKKTKKKKATKPQEVVNGHAQDAKTSEGQTYAEVAFNPTKDKKKPEIRHNVKETEYSAVQFGTGPREADEDSD